MQLDNWNVEERIYLLDDVRRASARYAQKDTEMKNRQLST